MHLHLDVTQCLFHLNLFLPGRINFIAIVQLPRQGFASKLIQTYFIVLKYVDGLSVFCGLVSTSSVQL